MKKLILCLSALALMAGAFSCGTGDKDGAKDSTLDSEIVEAVDSAEVENESAPQESANPEKDLSLTIEKKDLKYAPECSYKTGSLIVKVTNNGTAAVKGSDYVVAYDEIIEDWVGTPEDGGLEDVTKKRTTQGVDVAPGESVEIPLKSSDGCLDLKNPKIKNVA